MSRRSSSNSGPGVSDLIEESVHLLRRNPRELTWYYLGTGPFAVGLLYFWAYVTWFAPADGEVAAGALVLALLFGWMKTAQHRFALNLMARRLGEASTSWSRRQWVEDMGAQFRLQAPGIVMVPLAALFAVPFGWIYCYFQTATVLPATKPGDAMTRQQSAWAQMQLWPAQNHWALTILSGLWLMVFLNIAVAFYEVPAMATHWLGIKTIFSLSGWSYFNTTFLTLVAVLTHLLVDPLIKTFYVLRVFHAGAQHTGVDLKLVLAREKILRKKMAMGAALLLFGLMAVAPSKVRAAEAAPAAQSVPNVQSAPAPVLDRALNQVLDGADFRWRLRPLPAPPTRAKEGIIKGFVRSTFSIIRQMVLTVVRWVKEFSDWVSGLFPGTKEKTDADSDAAKARSGNAFDWMAALQLGAYVLLIAVGLLLLFVTWKVWQHNRGTRPIAASGPLPVEVPDLRDETVQASRLPADGWLDLARRQIAVGEWRLALRALFLATLARHAHQGWLSLAKFKTNLDYEIELKRRVHGRAVIVDEFRDRRQRFEEVWYGAVPASDMLVHDWLRQMEVKE